MPAKKRKRTSKAEEMETIDMEELNNCTQVSLFSQDIMSSQQTPSQTELNALEQQMDVSLLLDEVSAEVERIEIKLK